MAIPRKIVYSRPSEDALAVFNKFDGNKYVEIMKIEEEVGRSLVVYDTYHDHVPIKQTRYAVVLEIDTGYIGKSGVEDVFIGKVLVPAEPVPQLNRNPDMIQQAKDVGFYKQFVWSGGDFGVGRNTLRYISPPVEGELESVDSPEWAIVTSISESQTARLQHLESDEYRHRLMMDEDIEAEQSAD